MNRTNSPATFPRRVRCGAVFAVVLFVATGDGSQPFSGPRAVAGLAALTLAIPFLGYLVTGSLAGRLSGSWCGAAAGSPAPRSARGSPGRTQARQRGTELAMVKAHVAAGSELHAALAAIADGATVISLFPLAVCCAAIAVLAFRSRALPRWLA